ACTITASPDCNVVGVCAGGITSSLLLGHLTAAGDPRVHAMTVLVTMLDTQAQSMVGMFATEDAIRAAIRRSKSKGVLDRAHKALCGWPRVARGLRFFPPQRIVVIFLVQELPDANTPPAVRYSVLERRFHLPACQAARGFSRLVSAQPAGEWQ